MEPGLVLSEMQQMHSIGGGRFVGAGGGGLGDRRLRPHHHIHSMSNTQNHQTLKCPRCDSLNTKFCYYNNYNLSQPRHFCKSCRRYWTKGGVLRNVPVGGGCRKSKRSKPKHSSSSAAATWAPPPAPSSSQTERECKTSNSHSSSESSSLTAAAVPVGATEAVSVPLSNSASNNMSSNLQDSKLCVHSNSKPNSEPGVPEKGEDSEIFSEIENLTSLITPTNETSAFGYQNITDASSFQLCSQWQKGMNTSDGRHQELKFTEMTVTTATTAGWLVDQTVPVDLWTVQNKMGQGGWGPLDWQGSMDPQGLFDLPNTVDQALWSHSQRNEDNPSLFHLP